MHSCNFFLYLLLTTISLHTSNAENTNTGESFFKQEGEYCHGDSCTGSEKTVQSTKSPGSGSEETIHVMLTFYNAKYNQKLQNTFTQTVSSMLKHATVNLSIYIIGDEESQKLASEIIAKKSQNTNYNMVNIDVDSLAKKLEKIIQPMQEHFSYKTGAYYNHALFFLSLAMHRVLPNLKKVIMLDADLKFRDDIRKLYDRFRLFKMDNIIGIARDGQPVYRHTFWKYRNENPGTRVGNPPPDGLTGFNSGVLMLDLEKMRASKLYNSLLSAEHIKRLTTEFSFKGHLGDQDFFSLLSMKYEWLFHVLPCNWNRQLCQWWKEHGYKEVFDQYYKCEGDIKIYHGNCGTPIPDD